MFDFINFDITRFQNIIYLKSPADTLQQLYERYQDGGEYGWFALVKSEGTFAYWNTDTDQWELMAQQDISNLIKEVAAIQETIANLNLEQITELVNQLQQTVKSLDMQEIIVDINTIKANLGDNEVLIQLLQDIQDIKKFYADHADDFNPGTPSSSTNTYIQDTDPSLDPANVLINGISKWICQNSEFTRIKNNWIEL